MYVNLNYFLMVDMVLAVWKALWATTSKARMILLVFPMIVLVVVAKGSAGVGIGT